MNIKFMIKKQKLAANVLFYMSFSLALSASINTTAAETLLPNTALLGHEIPTTHLVYQEQAFKIYGDERSSLHREIDEVKSAALGDDAMKQLVKLMSQGHSIEDWLMSELKLDNKEQVNKAFKLFVDEEYRKYKQLG